MTVPVQGVGLRILIAEDNADGIGSMATWLRICGHDVEMATNGPTALAKARTDKADVVVLDLGLPGMSGYDVARQLSDHRTRQTPLLIAVTGVGREEDRQHSAEVAIDLHLVKPINPDDMQAVLKRFQQLLAEVSVYETGVTSVRRGTEGRARVGGWASSPAPPDKTGTAPGPATDRRSWPLS
jgi:CheY-like chemotaxis protein